ncbi:MAG: serine dehydratase, partial [Clostridiales bacterium]|nr:serine dehydratase [Clostridiales bacterium]
EGFGAGAASIAAATVALNGGTSSQMEQAIVLAMSPTIAVPCTPRVLVPALCTSHIGGAILIGMYAGKLCTLIDIGVNVPVDVMIAMASEVHVESARHVVPTVVEYMEPFFRRTDEVESLVDQEVKDAETQEINLTLEKAKSIAKGLARGTDTLINVFGDAVVGGSSQGVGSPTNAARIAHGLAKGEIRKIKIELYPELFARRTINIPGILMGAVFGSDTSDYEMYNKAISLTKEKGIEIEILEAEEESVQKITIETDEMTAMVDSLNRGGGRVHLRDATPSLEQAKKVAADLSIVLG